LRRGIATRVKANRIDSLQEESQARGVLRVCDIEVMIWKFSFFVA
jgi:hypothetical protein